MANKNIESNLIVDGTIEGTQAALTAAEGTAPLIVTSTTVATNLNADLLDGYHASTTANAAYTIPVRDSVGNLSLGYVKTNINPETTTAYYYFYAVNDSGWLRKKPLANVRAEIVLYGTTAGTAAEGNDSRLSDARTPTDNSVTYAKVAAEYKDRIAMPALNVDWAAGQTFTKTIAANSTITFSNLRVGTKFLEITGDYAIILPSGFTYAGGERSASGVTLIQVVCTDPSTPVGWYVILKDES